MPAPNQPALRIVPANAHRWWRIPAALLLGATIIGGCTSAPSGGLAGPGDGGDTPDASLKGLTAAAAYQAFAPNRVRIHPLTHVDASGSRGVLVLHYELRDRFGDSVKALGELKVELYKPGPGVMGSMESREASWTVAETLAPEGNSERFDRTTRTYRIQLFAPAWVHDWARADAATRADAPWIKVRVLYTALDADGHSKTLTDEFVVQGK